MSRIKTWALEELAAGGGGCLEATDDLFYRKGQVTVLCSGILSGKPSKASPCWLLLGPRIFWILGHLGDDC